MFVDHGGGIATLNEALRMVPFMDIGHQMTVLQGRQRQVVHSPTAAEAKTVSDLRKRGPVVALVAPSFMHNLYVAQWQEAFPEATLLAPEGFGAKNKTCRVDAPLTNETLARFIDDVEVIDVGGVPALRESVLIHGPSRSLIVADLLFNLPVQEGRLGRVVARMAGLNRRPGVSRLFRFLIKDRAALRRSIDEIGERSFDRLIVGHGEPIATGARTCLLDSYRFL